MNSTLQFKKIQKEHFETYDRWFKNDRIKKALGDIDDEWLEFILNNKTGVEYAIFQNNELIAVVGIQFPTTKDHSYGISNIAIHPNYFRKGIGSHILKRLYQLHPLKKGELWLAYTNEKNFSAQRFFEKNGWTKVPNHEANETMIRYENDLKNSFENS